MESQDKNNALLRRTKASGGWLVREERRSKGWKRPWEPSHRELERENTLIDFVGEERASSVFASLRPGFKQAGKIAEALVGDYDLKAISLLDHLRANWQDIVGADNASQCRPVLLENDALKIEVFSSTWLYILNSQKILICRRVGEATSGAVKRVHFIQKGTFKER